MERLNNFGPAFFGGFFFTFTIGAFLTFFSFSAAYIWTRFLLKTGKGLIFFLALWLLFLITANIDGFSFPATLFFLFIPPVVFHLTSAGAPVQGSPGSRLTIILPVVFFIILAVIFIFKMDTNRFLDIRDNLLLSTETGKKLNQFYYTYSLYPAQVFKAKSQRLIRTCNLSSVKDLSLAKRLQNKLLRHDYLPLKTSKTVDLELKTSKEEILLFNNGKEILSVSEKEFFTDTVMILRQFSEKCDPHVFFRQATFFSLVFMVALSFFLCLYAPLRIISGFFFKPIPSTVISGILFVLAGMTAIYSADSVKEKISSENLEGFLNNDSRFQRISALKTAAEKKMDITTFSSYKTILNSPHIPERYWLARALSISKSPVAFTDLLDLLDDSHINVVCMAYYSLGKRVKRTEKQQARKEILERLKTSDNWYIQGYAYKALRTLGWKQTGSH